MCNVDSLIATVLFPINENSKNRNPHLPILNVTVKYRLVLFAARHMGVLQILSSNTREVGRFRMLYGAI